MEEVKFVVFETDELESQEEPHANASFEFSANQVSAESNKT